MKSGKSFINISKEECKKVFPLILENAKRKIEIASQLEKSKFYSESLSILIIANEELVKSLVIALDSLGFSFRSVSGIDIIFRTHRIRHATTYIFYALGILADEFHKILTRFTPDDIVSLSKEIEDPNSIEYKSLEKKMNDFAERVGSELKWFAEIEGIRQNGFYCDYSNSPIYPQKLDIDDFEHLKPKLYKIWRAGNQIHSFLQLESSNKLIKKAIDWSNENNLYNNLSQYFKRVRRNRNNPFFD